MPRFREIGVTGSVRRPIIGLNMDYREAHDKSHAFMALNTSYVDAVLDAGGVPVLIPPNIQEEEDLEVVLDRLDGIVLTGGADLDCRNDGWQLHTSMRVLSPTREKFDRMLAKVVCEMKMPTIAIGVGMQLLNVVRGGTLSLHIPEDFPDAIPHVDPRDATHSHALVPEPGGIIETLYPDMTMRGMPLNVRSHHHQAVDDVAKGFRVSARGPDGIVEAIESTSDEWFAIGTQFHPESGSKLSLVLFYELIGRARFVRSDLLLTA